MKILAISHLFPHLKEKRYGIFVARQLSEIYSLGAEVTVIVPRIWCPEFLRRFKRWKEHDYTCPLCRFEGLETISVPFIRPPGNWYNRWSGLVLLWAIRKKALELHKKKKFDIIYATDLFPDGDTAVRLAKYMNLPVTCLAIGGDVNMKAPSNKILYRHFVRITKALDGILSCGQSVADKIDAVTGKRSLCVYGVLDLEEFSPAADKTSLRKELGLPLDKTVALYAGYLVEYKGIYEMLEAFFRIHKVEPNVMLCVCGSGKENLKFTQMVRERNLEHVIRILGEVHPDQMNKWMKASDLLVLASHTEGMPNAVMEAMACGLPVVTTAVGGLPAAVGNCEGAILVPPRDVEALKEAIIKVVNNRELRVRMGVAGRKKAEERFSIKRNARLILDYLQEIIEKTRAT